MLETNSIQKKAEKCDREQMGNKQQEWWIKPNHNDNSTKITC